MWNCVYYDGVKFRLDPTVKSPANSKTPSVVRIPRGRASQHECLNCSHVSRWSNHYFDDPFGEIVRNFVYYHSVKFSRDRTVESPENLKTPSVVWISCDPARQHKRPNCSHVPRCLKKDFSDPFGDNVRNVVYHYNVKFRRAPMVESPKNCKTPSVVWISHSRAGQHKRPTCLHIFRWLKKYFTDPFGGIVRNCVYYNLVKFRRDPTVQSTAK